MKVRNRAITVGLVAVAIIAALFVYLMWGPKGKETQDLHVALVKLQVAEQHGVALAAFSDLLFDARTKFELSKKHLWGWDSNKCQLALDAADDAAAIWRSSLNDFGEDAYLPMLRLGIVADRKAFEKIQRDIAKYKPNSSDSSTLFDLELKIQTAYRKQYIGMALSAFDKKIGPAVSATE